MVRSLALVSLLAMAAVALSGCSGQDAPRNGAPATDDGMTILGLVQNEIFAPIPGAHVTLRFTDQVVTTDVGGAFAFRDVALAPYLVDVVAPGFLNATLNAEPKANVSLSFVLYPPDVSIPPPVTVKFTGYYQCAFEAVIIPGSCDQFIDDNGQDPFADLSRFETGLGDRWSTAVVDVVFDSHPGLNGLHVTLRGRNDADKLADYKQYGQFSGSQSFTFKVEPDQSYDGSTAGPMPANATALQIDVYPQGHGYHALCSDPAPDVVPPGQCPLGVGVAQNVQFDLYVTVFFVDPAPEGFSLLP